MAQVDELSIAIKADSTEAIKQLDNVSKKISSISRALNTLGDAKKLSGMADNVQKVFDKFATADEQLSGVSREFDAITASINELCTACSSATSVVKTFVDSLGTVIPKGRSVRTAVNNITQAMNEVGAQKGAKTVGTELMVINQNAQLVAQNCSTALSIINNAGSTAVSTYVNLARIMQECTAVSTDLFYEVGRVVKTLRLGSGLEVGFARQNRSSFIDDPDIIDVEWREVADSINQAYVGIRNASSGIVAGANQAYIGMRNASGGIVAAIGTISDASAKAASSNNGFFSSFAQMFSKLKSIVQNIVAGIQNTFGRAIRDAWREASGIQYTQKDENGNDVDLSDKEIQAQKVSAAINNAGAAMKATFQQLNTIIGATVGKLLQCVNPIKLMQAGFKKLKSFAQNMVNPIVRIWRMLRLMVLRSVLRAMLSGVGEGFKNLIYYSDSFDQAVSLLWNDLRQLGNSIAAMVQPLVETFAPILDMIIQKIISVVNVINQVFSALAGKGTWTRAKKLNDDYRKSLDKTTQSQSKSLQSFDELNNITTNQNDTQTTANDMFEQAPIADKWLDFADDLKKAWETGDFFKIGKQIGDWLANFLADIPWDKIRAQAHKLGGALATLLNGIMSGYSEDGRSLGLLIGQTVAQAINTAFEFLNGFVHKLEWVKLGKFIADSLNGLFETIDWGLITNTFVAGAEGLASAINSFTINFHWDNISTTISKALNTLASTIYAFFSRTDWGSIGENLMDQLMKTLEKTDWERVGQALGSIIQAILDFVIRAISKLDMKKFTKAIGSFLKGVFETVDKGELVTVLVGIFGILFAGNWIKGSLAPFAAKFATNLLKILAVNLANGTILNSLLTVGKNLGGSLIFGFQSSFGQLAGVAKWFGTGSQFADSAALYGTGATMASWIFAGLATAWAGFHIGKWLGEQIAPEEDKKYYENFKWFGDEGFFDTMTQGVQTDGLKGVIEDLNAMGDAWTQMHTDVESNPVIPYITAILDPLGLVEAGSQKAFSYLKQCLQDGTAWETFKTKAQEAYDKVTAGLVWLGQKVYETFIQPTILKVENFAYRVKAIWEEIKLAAHTVVEAIREKFTGTIDKIREKFQQLKDWFNNTWLGEMLAGLRKVKEEYASSGFSWSSLFGGSTTVKAYANGGFPTQGQVFLARENGAELVGSMGGKTAVANNDQIVNGIASGVANANTQQNSLMSQMVTLLGEIADKDLSIGDDDIYRSFQRGSKRYTKRYGV